MAYRISGGKQQQTLKPCLAKSENDARRQHGGNGAKPLASYPVGGKSERRESNDKAEGSEWRMAGLKINGGICEIFWRVESIRKYGMAANAGDEMWRGASGENVENDSAVSPRLMA